MLHAPLEGKAVSMRRLECPAAWSEKHPCASAKRPSCPSERSIAQAMPRGLGCCDRRAGTANEQQRCIIRPADDMPPALRRRLLNAVVRRMLACIARG
jgi:hypothetical protein